MSGNRSDAEGGADAGSGTAADEATRIRGWSAVNWVVIVGFTGLTLFGMALSVGTIESVVTAPENPSGVTVPPYVYLYAGLGALGYVFTKLMVQFDRYTEWSKLDQLVGMAMRIPAAWIIAAGVYLLAGALTRTGGTGGARFIAGVSFLVGLYVNVALKALGSVADRVLGRGPRRNE